MNSRLLLAAAISSSIAFSQIGCLPSPAEPKADKPATASSGSTSTASTTGSTESTSSDKSVDKPAETSSTEPKKPSPSTTEASPAKTTDAGSTPAPEKTSTSPTEPAASPVEPAKEETAARSLNGKYRVVSAVTSGTPFPAELTNTMSLELKDNLYQVNIGIAVDKGETTTNWDTNPGQLTIKGTEGPNTGKTILAIFEKTPEGQLRVSYDLEGKAFPTSFESTPENKYFVATYELAKEQSSSEEAK